MSSQLITFNLANHYLVSTKRPKPLIWAHARVELWRTSGTRPGHVMVWTSGQTLEDGCRVLHRLQSHDIGEVERRESDRSDQTF